MTGYLTLFRKKCSIEILSHNENGMSNAENNFREEKKKLMELFKRSARIVSTYLSVLNNKERSVVERRFGLKTGKRMTLDAIGKEDGCTRENIRQIESKAIKKMLKFYSELIN